MAKTKMKCPFSEGLCRECPLYRGRHYYLCFHSKYRGYLGSKGEKKEQKSWSQGPNRNFEMPSELPQSPTWLVLNEFAEREKK